MWHAIIVPQSAFLIISATQWSLSNTKPRDLLSCNMVKHLLTTGISAPPYLGISKPRKTPNLNRFYKRKRKNWAHSIKNWNDMFGNWSISTRDLYLQKSWFSKIHTFYKRKIPLLFNLTQFYTPGNNPNLKNEFIWKTPFSKNKDPCPTIGHKYQTGQKKSSRWEIRITDYVLSWPLGQH